MQNVHLAVLTRGPLDQRSFAEMAWQAIVEGHVDFRPSRFGNYEPLRYKVGEHFDVAEALTHWQDPVLWSNGRRASGSFWFGNKNVHSTISIDCTGTRVSGTVLIELLCKLAALTAADFAHVDYRCLDEAEWIRRYKALYPMSLGPTTHDLRRSIPELSWAVVFGSPYIELFTPQVLAACPAYESRQLSTDLWLIRLTEHPPDHGGLGEYEVARERVKEFLGREHFLDLARPEAQRKAPLFEWSPEVRNAFLDHLRKEGLLKE